MEYLITILQPSDRLSIISFSSKAQRLCGLTSVTPEQTPQLLNYINQLYADGGTDIN